MVLSGKETRQTPETRRRRRQAQPWRIVPPFASAVLTDGRDGAGRFAAGTHIPLTVFNAPDAVRTEWFFDGIPVVPDSEGLFIITQRGILRAMVYREDGSVDILEKEVQVR